MHQAGLPQLDVLITTHAETRSFNVLAATFDLPDPVGHDDEAPVHSPTQGQIPAGDYGQGSREHPCGRSAEGAACSYAGKMSNRYGVFTIDCAVFCHYDL